MRASFPTVVCVMGLLIVAPAFATPQGDDPSDAIGTSALNNLPPDAVIDEINFVGLHRIAAETAKSRLSSHCGEEFDAVRMAADIRALNQRGWCEDVFVKAEESHLDSKTPIGGPRRFQLEYHVREYPFLTDVEFSGSKLLSEQQIKKLLTVKKLSP